MSTQNNVTLQDARAKAREIHFGQADGKAPGQHQADDLVHDLLYDALTQSSASTRRGRARLSDARALWDGRRDEKIADQITQVYEGEAKNDVESRMEQAGLVNFEDQYTAERVRNQRTEVLTRYVTGLIVPQTNIVNNFYKTVRADAGQTLGSIREFVVAVETYSDWTYHRIDPNRGDIRSLEVDMTQHSERINPQMGMYGVKVEYENFLHRVMENVHIAELMAMLSVGWAKASAMQRESDASKFLTNYLDPQPVFDNNANSNAPLGQLSGVGLNGKQNGTFSTDYDFPRLLDHMENDLGMSTNNLIMLLPRNAWAFMNTRKGYRRFLGTDGEPLYQRPQATEGPRHSLADDDRYGIKNKAASYKTPSVAAKYLAGSREGAGARAAESMVPGPMPFLPDQVPNWMNTFVLPNSAFGPMRVVLTPFAHADHRFYAEGHELRDDPNTGKPRPVMTTDVLFFDGNHPLYLIESIPPTSWTATNDEYRKSVMVMVEAYALANSARGQQACTIKGAVLDHNYEHDLYLNAADIANPTERPLAGGSGNPDGLTKE